MLNLPQPSDDVLEKYYKSIRKRVEDAVKKSRLKAANKIFTSEVIEDIIKSKPEEFKEIHDGILLRFIVNFNLTEYDVFFEIKRKKPKSRTRNQKKIFTKYNSTISKLSLIFNYNEFISNHKETSYELASVHNRNTCTYCNRLYTITINNKDEKTGKHNDLNRITRPQFDHWFSKSRYPLLALSFYNLIPSCNVCNSSLKGDANFSLDTHLHPYIDKGVNEFMFSFNYKSVHENNVRINVNAGSKAETTLKEFKIQEVYNAHSNLELKDMLDLKYKYSEDYIKTLFGSTFKNLEVSEKEAYRLIFGIEHDEEHFHKRPFSKFKKDILEELKKIDR